MAQYIYKVRNMDNWKPLDTYVESDANSNSYERTWKIGPHHSNIVAKFNTRCTEVCVLETRDFGKVVMLDGEIQSTAADQEFYHQALCRPALACGQGPLKRILILGGGELCTLKQVLSWPDVEHVDMVDYDQTFVEFSKRRLRDWHDDCYKDERAHIHFADAWSWKPEGGLPYDSIIVDLTDISLDADKWPLEVDHWSNLMHNMMKQLRPNGSMTVYVGMFIPWKSEAMVAAHNALKNIMKEQGRTECLQPYRVFVPSFASGEAFFLCLGAQSIRDSIDGRLWSKGGFFGPQEAARSIIWPDCGWHAAPSATLVTPSHSFGPSSEVSPAPAEEPTA